MSGWAVKMQRRAAHLGSAVAACAHPRAPYPCRMEKSVPLPPPPAPPPPPPPPSPPSPLDLVEFSKSCVIDVGIPFAAPSSYSYSSYSYYPYSYWKVLPFSLSYSYSFYSSYSYSSYSYSYWEALPFSFFASSFSSYYYSSSYSHSYSYSYSSYSWKELHSGHDGSFHRTFLLRLLLLLLLLLLSLLLLLLLLQVESVFKVPHDGRGGTWAGSNPWIQLDLVPKYPCQKENIQRSRQNR